MQIKTLISILLISLTARRPSAKIADITRIGGRGPNVLTGLAWSASEGNRRWRDFMPAIKPLRPCSVSSGHFRRDHLSSAATCNCDTHRYRSGQRSRAMDHWIFTFQFLGARHSLKNGRFIRP